MDSAVDWQGEIDSILHGEESGLTTERLAQKLEQRGSIPDQWKRKRWWTAAKRKVREVLRETKRPDGLPSYGQRAEPDDETGQHRWVQDDFMELEDWLYERQKRVTQRDALQEEIDRIDEYIHNRFGFRPTKDRKPGLSYGDEPLTHGR